MLTGQSMHSAKRLKDLTFEEKIPDWDYKGTTHLEEMVLITQSIKEVQMIMSNYVELSVQISVLKEQWYDLKYFIRRQKAFINDHLSPKKICELRNLINVGYIIIKMAKNRQESIGLHYSIDYPKRAISEF